MTKGKKPILNQITDDRTEKLAGDLNLIKRLREATGAPYSIVSNALQLEGAWIEPQSATMSDIWEMIQESFADDDRPPTELTEGTLITYMRDHREWGELLGCVLGMLLDDPKTRTPAMCICVYEGLVSVLLHGVDH